MVQTPVRAVFCFEGGDLTVHDSLESAADFVEAIDVENEEFDFFGDDGTIIAASVDHQVVHLVSTDDQRPEELRARLDTFLTAINADPEVRSSDDVLAIAQYLVEGQWARLWPRRPKWLARRLHGEGPPTIQRT